MRSLASNGMRISFSGQKMLKKKKKKLTPTPPFSQSLSIMGSWLALIINLIHLELRGLT
jgi:hypothetical protein